MGSCGSLRYLLLHATLRPREEWPVDPRLRVRPPARGPGAHFLEDSVIAETPDGRMRCNLRGDWRRYAASSAQKALLPRMCVEPVAEVLDLVEASEFRSVANDLYPRLEVIPEEHRSFARPFGNWFLVCQDRGPFRRLATPPHGLFDGPCRSRHVLRSEQDLHDPGDVESLRAWLASSGIDLASWMVIGLVAGLAPAGEPIEEVGIDEVGTHDGELRIFMNLGRRPRGASGTTRDTEFVACERSETPVAFYLGGYRLGGSLEEDLARIRASAGSPGAPGDVTMITPLSRGFLLENYPFRQIYRVGSRGDPPVTNLVIADDRGNVRWAREPRDHDDGLIESHHEITHRPRAARAVMALRASRDPEIASRWTPESVQLIPTSECGFIAADSVTGEHVLLLFNEWGRLHEIVDLGPVRGELGRVGRIMEDRDPKTAIIRHHAALALRTVGGAEAIEALLVALKDPDHRVNLAAAKALAALKVKTALGPLVDMLQDRSLIEPAAIALRELDPAAACDLLALHIEEDLENRIIWIFPALDVLEADPIEVVLPRMTVPGARMRERAAEIFTRITWWYPGRSEQFVATLRQYFEGTEGARIPAAEQVALLAVLDEPRQLQLMLDGAPGTEEFPPDRFVPYLHRMGSHQINAMIPALESPHTSARLGAATLLDATCFEAATPALIASLSDADPRVRRVAERALRKFRDPRAKAAVATLPGSEPVAPKILEPVARRHDPAEDAAIDAAIAEGSQSADPGKRAMALRLRIARYGMSVDEILELLADPDPNSQMMAHYLIQQTPHPRFAEPLLEALRRHPEAEMRKSALHLLMQLRPPLEVQYLAELLRDPLDHARYFAAMYLGEQKSREAEELLIATMADPSGTEEFRKLCLELLARMKGLELVDMVLELLARPEDGLVTWLSAMLREEAGTDFGTDRERFREWLVRYRAQHVQGA